MTKWLDIALEEMGTDEVAGARANPKIIGYFRDAGREDILSDEVAWCAAFMGACLSRAGLKNDIAEEKRLLARSYENFGTKIDLPRRGAIAIFSRGNPNGWTGHVAFVLGQTDEHIIVIGGNQSNAVTVAHYPKSRLIALRWPGELVKPKDLANAGSRTAIAAQRMKRDVVKAGALIASGQSVPDGAAVKLPALKELAADAGQLKGSMELLISFSQYAIGHWPWIAGIGGAYYLIQLLIGSNAVAWLRADDHNTGANSGRDI